MGARTTFEFPAISESGTWTFPNLGFWQAKTSGGARLAYGVTHERQRVYRTWSPGLTIEAELVRRMYLWNGSSWAMDGIGLDPIPGFPLAWNPATVGTWVDVQAIVCTATAGLLLEDVEATTVASRWVASIGDDGAGDPADEEIAWTVDIAALPVWYSRQEVHSEERYSHALHWDQLQATSYYDSTPDGVALSCSCGSSSASWTEDYGPSVNAPNWHEWLEYDVGYAGTLVLDDPPPAYHFEFSRLGDVMESSWTPDEKYPVKGSTTIVDDEDVATYTFGAHYQRGTVTGDGPWTGTPPSSGDYWEHEEYGQATHRCAFRMKATDVLTPITTGDGLQATITYIDDPVAVPGVASFDFTPGSAADNDDPTATGPITVTLTGASLLAAGLPQGDPKMPFRMWGLDAVSNEDPDDGPRYSGAYQSYREGNLNLLRPNDVAAAPSIWVANDAQATLTQDETEATFSAAMLGPAASWTKTLRHHFWSVWSEKTKLISTDSAPPNGTAEADLWQWQFNFDDTDTKRKHALSGFTLGAEVPCLDGVVDWENGTNVAVALPANQAEDVHSLRCYGSLRLVYRWTLAGSTAPDASLSLSTAHSTVLRVDNQNTNVSDRLEGYEVTRSDHAHTWTVTISDTGAGDGEVILDLLDCTTELEIVNSLTLAIASGTPGAVFELLSLAAICHDPTTDAEGSRTLLWRAQSRRRFYGDEPKLPREYTGFWLWCDGMHANSLEEGELVHWSGTNPHGHEFCNSIVANSAVKEEDQLFPFGVWSRVVGVKGLEGFFGVTELEEGDAAMAPFYDADGNFYGPTYASDWLEGVEDVVCHANHDCAEVAGSWKPEYAIVVGQVIVAEGLCWAHVHNEVRGVAIELYLEKFLKSPRVVRPQSRGLAGDALALWETDGTTARQVCTEVVDHWGLCLFPRGVQECWNDEAPDSANPDRNRKPYRGAVVPVADTPKPFQYVSTHAQELPYWGPAVGGYSNPDLEKDLAGRRWLALTNTLGETEVFVRDRDAGGSWSTCGKPFGTAPTERPHITIGGDGMPVVVAMGASGARQARAYSLGAPGEPSSFVLNWQEV